VGQHQAGTWQKETLPHTAPPSLTATGRSPQHPDPSQQAPPSWQVQEMQHDGWGLGLGHPGPDPGSCSCSCSSRWLCGRHLGHCQSLGPAPTRGRGHGHGLCPHAPQRLLVLHFGSSLGPGFDSGSGCHWCDGGGPEEGRGLARGFFCPCPDCLETGNGTENWSCCWSWSYCSVPGDRAACLGSCSGSCCGHPAHGVARRRLEPVVALPHPPPCFWSHQKLDYAAVRGRFPWQDARRPN
jgi:hypothetical protein